MPTYTFLKNSGLVLDQSGIYENQPKHIELVSKSKGNANSTTLTYSHTVKDSYNRILIVNLAIYRYTPTSVTYGGVEMTLLASAAILTTYNVYSKLYYLLNPPVGTADVAITATSGTKASIACSYSGVHQTTPFGSYSTSTSTTTSITATGSSEPDDLVIDCMANYANATPTCNAAQTLIDLEKNSTTISNGASYLKATSSSTAMAWNNTLSYTALVVANMHPYYPV